MINHCSSTTLNISGKSPFETSRAVFWSQRLNDYVPLPTLQTFSHPREWYAGHKYKTAEYNGIVVMAAFQATVAAAIRI